MVDDILEPIAEFESNLKATHATHTAACFEALLKKSGVDEAANTSTVKKLRSLEERIGQTSSTRFWWRFARVGAILISLGFIWMGYSWSEWWWYLGAVAMGALAFGKLNAIIGDATAQLRKLEGERDETLATAWQQVAPLNALYSWDIASDLIQQTVPRIQLDPYFTNARLEELRDAFGWSDEFNADRSITFSYSGALNGNPFVIAQSLRHWIGSKTYDGHLEISWTERVRDSKGNVRTEIRRETLHASVTKPFPEYDDAPAIVYGNEAAPDLTFSRKPSSLSAYGDGAFGKWQKDRAIKKLEKKSRKADAGNQFTVMANREFDAVFGATDRNHEVQFRLLFTALAQQEMLKVMTDTTVGYGDCFAFTKKMMVNVVEPAHLSEIDISADPSLFQSYEVAHARTFFKKYHAELFRTLYFGLAPLLAIPLYQQHRSHLDIYRHVLGRKTCFWEHEAIANHFGEERLKHPDCATRSILKTEVQDASGDAQTVRVMAYGYRGVERVDYVSKRGGDGNYHDVPVHWIDYHPVSKNSTILVSELPQSTNSSMTTPEDQWRSAFEGRGVPLDAAVVRRSVASALV